MDSAPNFPLNSLLLDGIPVIWIEPLNRYAATRLALWLPPFSTRKEIVESKLRDLARAGLFAMSFDPYQHGARSAETSSDLTSRIFSNFQRHMWPILGQTTLDALRVIDWALDRFQLKPDVFVGGDSMGGDIAVALAGKDKRITRVVAIVATPDWMRPGMHRLHDPDRLQPLGEPDAYARFFYEHLNPLTHLENYTHGPSIFFECGANDTHVPSDGALRFKVALEQKFPALIDRVRVNIVPGAAHMDSKKPPFWENALHWLTT